jgi:hypothetical protein
MCSGIPALLGVDQASPKNKRMENGIANRIDDGNPVHCPILTGASGYAR